MRGVQRASSANTTQERTIAQDDYSVNGRRKGSVSQLRDDLRVTNDAPYIDRRFYFASDGSDVKYPIIISSQV